MKIITSITFFSDSVGMRMSATYSEVDDSGTITADNQRFDRVVTDSKALNHANALFEFAKAALEG